MREIQEATQKGGGKGAKGGTGGGVPKEVRLKKSKVFSKRSNARLACFGGSGIGGEGHGHRVAKSGIARNGRRL